MKKVMLLLFFGTVAANAQINSKLEGITINSPCELEYIRNLGNQNNYSCPFEYGNGKLDNYSVTVANLQNEMSGFTGSSLVTYKNTFLETIKSNSESFGEKAEYIKLPNGIDAVSMVSNLTYADQNLKNIAIAFLYKQKSFVVNLTTSNFERTNDVENLIKRILFR